MSPALLDVLMRYFKVSHYLVTPKRSLFLKRKLLAVSNLKNTRAYIFRALRDKTDLFQGPIKPSKVTEVALSMADMGCYEISLGDTIGVGTPGSIRAVLDEVISMISPSMLAAHFHDTYGQALANLLVALDSGITVIDSSAAGVNKKMYFILK